MTDTTLVVPTDMVVDLLRLNARDRTSQQSHTLAFSRPLDGRVEASHHVSGEGNRWATDNPPLELDPDALVERDLSYPDYAAEKSRCSDHYDGNPTPEQLSDWWGTAVNVWRENVQSSLVDTVDIAPYYVTESHTVPVEYVD